jgi:hypothetical protein
MLKEIASAAVALIALAACTPAKTDPAPGQPDDGASPAGDCRADEFRSLVGSNVAAISLPAGLNHRILGPDDAATMDYSPSRLNILTDRDGVVTEVKCG